VTNRVNHIATICHKIYTTYDIVGRIKDKGNAALFCHINQVLHIIESTRLLLSE
jgi:hypothetical protein